MSRVRDLLCWLLCPRYTADRPADATGDYLAVAYTVTAFGAGHWQDARKVRGRLQAYKTARWLALKADFMGSIHPEVGIYWKVVSITELDHE